MCLRHACHLRWPGASCAAKCCDHNLHGATVNRCPSIYCADTSWLGIGLSETGSMKGADLWVLMRGDDGTWALTDRHAEGFSEPIEDSHQDVKLLSRPNPADAAAGRIMFTFSRHLAPCDTDDLHIIRGVPSIVMWAHGSAWGYHGPVNRGSASLLIAAAALAPLHTSTLAVEEATQYDADSVIESAKHWPPQVLPEVDLDQDTTAANAALETDAAAATDAPQSGRTFAVVLPKVEIPTDINIYMYKLFKLPSDRCGGGRCVNACRNCLAGIRLLPYPLHVGVCPVHKWAPQGATQNNILLSLII